MFCQKKTPKTQKIEFLFFTSEIRIYLFLTNPNFVVIMGQNTILYFFVLPNTLVILNFAPTNVFAKKRPQNTKN